MGVIVGIDEVGRGCWAGPIVAAAVILAEPIPGLKDSKLLSRRQREKLNSIIQSQAQAIGLGWVGPAAIDSGGITAAVKAAMAAALAQIDSDYTEVIIDGQINYLMSAPRASAQIKADKLIPAVSAASIVAKVARDAYMYQQAKQFPQYGFERHVGYGTAEHRLALKEYGICRLHRRSFRPVSATIAT